MPRPKCRPQRYIIRSNPQTELYLTRAGTGDRVGILEVRYIAPGYLFVRTSVQPLFYKFCQFSPTLLEQ